MSDRVQNMWFFMVFLPMIPIIYRALHAIDTTKAFKRNRTWEIMLLYMLVSVTVAYLTAESFVRFISVIASFFV